MKEGDPDKLSYTELDHFVRCVEHLSIGAIRLLGTVIERAGHKSQGYGRAQVDRENVRVDFGELRTFMPDAKPDLILGLVCELIGQNLLHGMLYSNVRYGNGDEHKYHNYPIETTPLGYRFVKYVLENTSKKQGESLR